MTAVLAEFIFSFLFEDSFPLTRFLLTFLSKQIERKLVVFFSVKLLVMVAFFELSSLSNVGSSFKCKC